MSEHPLKEPYKIALRGYPKDEFFNAHDADNSPTLPQREVNLTLSTQSADDATQKCKPRIRNLNTLFRQPSIYRQSGDASIVIHDTSFWRKTSLLPHSSARACVCKELIWPRFRRLPERRPSEIPDAIANRCCLKDHAAWNRWPEASHSTRCAAGRGGARVGRPRCARSGWPRAILTITGGSSMAAMIVRLPAQFDQRSMSRSNTRFNRRAQLRRAVAPCT